MTDTSPGIRRRICYVVSSEMTVAAFLRPHIAQAAKCYDVTVAVNTTDDRLLTGLGLQAGLLKVPLVRSIRPLQDLIALWSLFRTFRTRRFDLVHSVSPKAGLLGMLAAWLACVPVRVHTFTGQVWATRRGWKRALLKAADRLLAALTTHPLVDSPSQLDFLVVEGVLPPGKAAVIGKGSICGVDTERFRPDPTVRSAVRSELGIPTDAVVLLFLGRLNQDKGIPELIDAFAALAARRQDCVLLLVGPDEGNMLFRLNSLDAVVRDRVRHIGYTRHPERYLAAADVFCLPSHREGFGMSIIEAAAAGLPVAASRIYGVTDAVIDGETGLLHPPGDRAAIESVLSRLAGSEALRETLGTQARRRVEREFAEAAMTRGQMAFYGKILG